ncbi:MAG: hypothetical protein DHS20C13_30220 [Thermodesulfobacteriota bacterium]|nr:MAG: hypothetical protein DHS20C13_30220 [Thermodesulfobacteriota bacterium]
MCSKAMTKAVDNGFGSLTFSYIALIKQAIKGVVDIAIVQSFKFQIDK